MRALAALADLEDRPTPDILEITDAGSLEAVALLSGGRAHFLAGDFTEARAWLERCLASGGTLFSGWRVHALGSLALLEAWGGGVVRATELAEEALSVADLAGSFADTATADALLAKALVAVKRGDCIRAEHELLQADSRVAVNRRTQLAWIAYAIGSELRSLAGDQYEGSVPPGTPPPLAADSLAALRARDQRLNGEPAAALTLLAGRSADSSAVLFERGLALLALGRLDETREVQRLHSNVPDAEAPLQAVRSLLLEMALSAALGRTARTDTLLQQALRIADDHDVVSVFTDAGPEITSHIVRLGLPSLPPVATRVVRSVSDVARVGGSADLAEPLTVRERELLLLLPTRFTNTELADRYFVSVNTIKSHIAHIYRKLQVSTRSGAIERATSLGLIVPRGDATLSGP